MSATQDFRTVIHAVRKGWRRTQGPMRRQMLLLSGEYIRTSNRKGRR